MSSTHTQQQQTNDLPRGLHYLIRTMDINTDIQNTKWQKKKKKKSVLLRRALRRHPHPGKGERSMKVMSVIHKMRQGEKASKGPAWVKAAHEKQRSANTSCCLGIKQEGAKVKWQSRAVETQVSAAAWRWSTGEGKSEPTGGTGSSSQRTSDITLKREKQLSEAKEHQAWWRQISLESISLRADRSEEVQTEGYQESGEGY